ncbi:MAG: hypothetical protein WCS43_11110 [Verrucomicrobiota bacterium]
MNVPPSVVLLAIAAAGLAAAQDNSTASVRFSNDDRLTGSMESLTADLLVWKSPLLEKPAPFSVKKVMELNLPGSLPENVADHEALATLTNGDVVRGQLSSVTDEAVSLDTPYAGRMNLNRLNVSSLKIQARSAALYRGPTGMDGWKTTGSKPAWTYAGGAFRSDGQGGIGKEDVLPEECSVSFDTAWKGDSFGFKVVIFSKDVTKDFSRNEGAAAGYELTFQRGGFFVRNCKTNGFLGNGQAQEFLENEKVRLEIRASRKTGKLCMLINDRVTEVWNDPDFKKGVFGGCLQFISQSSMPLRISGIVISEWNGVVDQMPDPQAGGGMAGFRGMRFGMGGVPIPGNKPPAKEKTKAGRMELANGDSIEGEPTAIKDGFVQIKSPFGEIKLPVARLRDINLKKEALETSIRRKGDVRAWFPDGTSLVFRLDGVGDDVLTGSSQNFGTAKFNINTITRIEFNIHDPALEDKRGSNDW